MEARAARTEVSPVAAVAEVAVASLESLHDAKARVREGLGAGRLKQY